MQRYTAPRMQGRVNAASNLFILLPQTMSIAVGAAVISLVDYRVLLVLSAVVTGACGAVLLRRPAPAPQPETEASEPAVTP
jgi:hypothetical protein